MAADSWSPTVSQQLIVAGQRMDPSAPIYNTALRFDRAFRQFDAEAGAMRMMFDFDSPARGYLAGDPAPDLLRTARCAIIRSHFQFLTSLITERFPGGLQ